MRVGVAARQLDQVRYTSHSTRQQPMRIETQPQDHPTATTGETARLLVSFELSQSKWVLTVRAPAEAQSCRASRFRRATRRRPCRACRRGAAPASGAAHRPAGADREYLRGRAGRVLAAPLAGDAGGREAMWSMRHRSSARSAGLLRQNRPDRRGEAAARPGCLAGRRSGCVLDGGALPSVAQEDLRRLSRRRGELVDERTRLSNRVGGTARQPGDCRGSSR